VPESTFSNELAEFVSLCLNKNEIKRPSANDLLKHHWLRKHPTDDMLLSASLEKMML
jgi:serine/threonine protein kinase|tara:strand:+ start:299 stop:469 length:171 start_codon:yes stop_codon:yes gene_type:complete